MPTALADMNVEVAIPVDLYPDIHAALVCHHITDIHSRGTDEFATEGLIDRGRTIDFTDVGEDE